MPEQVAMNTGFFVRMCDGGTVEYLRDLVCQKEALQVETNQLFF